MRKKTESETQRTDSAAAECATNRNISDDYQRKRRIVWERDEESLFPHCSLLMLFSNFPFVSSLSFCSSARTPVYFWVSGAFLVYFYTHFTHYYSALFNSCVELGGKNPTMHKLTVNATLNWEFGACWNISWPSCSSVIPPAHLETSAADSFIEL